MQLVRLGWLLMSVMLGLVGCSGTQSTTQVIPLARDKPTFVYFFTDP